MFRRARRLVAALIIPVVVLTFAPVVMAGTQGSCSPGSSAGSLKLWENAIGDTSDNNDVLWAICNTAGSISNLGNKSHTLAGACKATVKFGDNWNDCVDSFTVWLPSSSWRACLYNDANFGANTEIANGPQFGSRYGISPGDQLSSVKITYLQAC